jgi:hypothetical protein
MAGGDPSIDACCRERRPNNAAPDRHHAGAAVSLDYDKNLTGLPVQFCPNHLKLPSPPKHSRMPMGRAVEHRWYGDVAPWSEEQLEQYCRDMGFSPLQPEENVPTPDDAAVRRDQ